LKEAINEREINEKEEIEEYKKNRQNDADIIRNYTEFKTRKSKGLIGDDEL